MEGIIKWEGPRKIWTDEFIEDLKIMGIRNRHRGGGGVYWKQRYSTDSSA
jgi:hypothetical protein